MSSEEDLTTVEIPVFSLNRDLFFSFVPTPYENRPPAKATEETVLKTIEELSEILGRPPKLREVGEILGVTRERVRQICVKLRAKGKIVPTEANLVIPGLKNNQDLQDEQTLSLIRQLTVVGRVPPKQGDLVDVMGSGRGYFQRSIKRLVDKGVLWNSPWLVEKAKDREYTRVDYFWSKVNRKGPDDCWMWLDGRHAEGYGHICESTFGDGYAHRVAYMLTHGFDSIAPGMFIATTCNNKGCCNPAHLIQIHPSELVTCKNYDDWWGNHERYTEEQVRDIRRRADKGESVSSIYKDYWDCSTYGCLSKIAKGESYKDVE
jgi:hypothetical protein